MGLVTFRTFDNPAEAYLLQAYLVDSGIECYIKDDNIIAMNQLYSNAIGGIKLLIKDIDLDTAEQLVSEINNKPSEDNAGNIIICPKCGSKEIIEGFKSFKGTKGILSAITSFLLMVFPIHYKNVFKCKNCGKEFHR